MAGEVNGHIGRWKIEGAVVALSYQNSVEYDTKTVVVAHQDINPGVTEPSLEVEMPVSRTIRGSVKFYFKESASYATLLTAWKAGTILDCDFVNGATGAMKETVTAFIKRLSKESNEGSFITCTADISAVTDVVVATV